MIQEDVIVWKVQRAVQKFIAEHNRDHCIQKIAAELDITENLVDELLDAPRWDSNLALSAMEALGVEVPLNAEDASHRVKPTRKEFDRMCRCLDCGVHTKKIHEYYCLTRQVWYSATKHHGGRGMLCIGCLENRLGRELVATDFEANVPINSAKEYKRSKRFKERLNRVAVQIA